MTYVWAEIEYYPKSNAFKINYFFYIVYADTKQYLIVVRFKTKKNRISLKEIFVLL